MTSDDFANLVQALAPGMRGKAVLDAVQFQLNGKTFATLGWPEQGWAVVKVDPRRQTDILRLAEGLAPEPGRRRKAGIVLVRLAAVDADVATEVLSEGLAYAQRGARRGRLRDDETIADGLDGLAA